MQRLRSLEMLRAIAALLVVSFHTPIILAIPFAALPLSNIVHSSYRGVDLFFVLSGFIIAHIHAADVGHPGRLGNYAFNRVARVYPAVWMMTLVASILSGAGWGIVDAAIRPGLWNAVASVFLLPQTGDAVLNVSWSLKYELVFYFFFGGLIVDQWIGAALLATWQLALLTVALTPHFESLGPAGFYLRSISLEFSVGLACAWLIAQPRFVSAMRTGLTQWGLLVLGVGAFVSGMAIGSQSHLPDACCAFGAGAIVVALVLLEHSRRLWVPDVAVILGGASYAIYLVHYSAISVLAYALAHILDGPVPMAMYAPAVAFGTLMGVAFNHAFDRPVQRLLRERVKPLLLTANPKPPGPDRGRRPSAGGGLAQG
jgi:exopolysaccharide production protein ExoZ